MISVIIPHKNRNGILYQTIRRLHQFQVLRRDLFEIIVVDDGSDTLPQKALELGADVLTENRGKGPGVARNTGAEIARYPIVLFIGNDTIPDKFLLFRHLYQHTMTTNQHMTCVQGLTLMHPQVMDTEFMHFLDKSGLQANWSALQNEDGTWKQEAHGYLLTTNWSIKKNDLLRNNGFHPSLAQAAWDDVELGMRLNKLGFRTVFDPSALNFHYHKYTLRSFALRQRMEGRNRLYFAIQHPEVSGNLLPSNELRGARHASLDEYLHMAQYEVARLNIRIHPQEIQEYKYNTWMGALQLASLKGILDCIEAHPLAQVIEHLHTKEQVTYAVSGIAGIEEEDYGWASHCEQWLIGAAEGNWAAWAYSAEIALAMGDNALAMERFRQSMDIAPSDWARDRLNEHR